ncbi:MAG: hypothetical protein GC159_07170 [Phycisphaera sp.]|nr:hypothetical protein [Phycisphaera sp.]
MNQFWVLPMVVTWLIGAALTFRMVKHQRRAFVLVPIGMLASAMIALFTAYYYAAVPQMAEKGHWDFEKTNDVVRMFNMISHGLHIGALGVLIAGIVRGVRPDASTQDAYLDDEPLDDPMR